MKKHLFAAVFCLCLLIGLLPGMGTTAVAAGEHADHTGWKTLSGTIYAGTLDAGNYVLTGDVTLAGDLAFGNEEQESISTVICLNGHKIKGEGNQYTIYTYTECMVTICDCTGNGTIESTRLSGIQLTGVSVTGSSMVPGLSKPITISGCEIKGLPANRRSAIC